MLRIRKNKKIIMTNDPSITGWGWAVIAVPGDVVLAVGCIKTASEAKSRRIRKGDDTVRRVSEIVMELKRIIKLHGVHLILSELPHGSQSASAAVMIGVVAGVAQTIADCLDIPIEWFTEGDSKKALLNKRSATKHETVHKVGQLYEVPFTGVGYKDEAIADAMSVYHVAKQTSQLLRLMNAEGG